MPTHRPMRYALLTLMLLALAPLFWLAVLAIGPRLERAWFPPAVGFHLGHIGCDGRDALLAGWLIKGDYPLGPHQLVALDVLVHTPLGRRPAEWIDESRGNTELVSRTSGETLIGHPDYPIRVKGACGLPVEWHTTHRSLTGLWAIHSAYGPYVPGDDRYDLREMD